MMIYLKNNPYPFDFLGESKDGILLFGDFSNGFFGADGWIKGVVQWEVTRMLRY